MNRLTINAIALAVGFTFGGGAIAQGLTKNDYEAGKQRIETDYRAAKANCASLSGNPNDVCLLEAKGSERIARSQLDARYGVAKERCDVYAGGAKDVCLDRAKTRFGKS